MRVLFSSNFTFLSKGFLWSTNFERDQESLYLTKLLPASREPRTRIYAQSMVHTTADIFLVVFDRLGKEAHLYS
jgi:hypothetical protein